MPKILIFISILLLNISNAFAQTKLDANLRLAKTSLSKFKQNKEDFKSLHSCFNHLENAAADTSNRSNHLYWTTRAEALALTSELWISSRLYHTGDSTNIPRIDQAALEANSCLITALKLDVSQASYTNIANQLQVNIINLYNEGLCNMNTRNSLSAYAHFNAIGELGDLLDNQKIALYAQNEHLRKSSFLMAAMAMDAKKENPEFCRLLARSFDYQMQSEDLYRSLCYCESISSDSLMYLRVEAITSYPALEGEYQKALMKAFLREQKADAASLQIVADYIHSQPEDYEAFLIAGRIYEIKSKKSFALGDSGDSKKYFDLAKHNLEIASQHGVPGASAALGALFFSVLESGNGFMEEPQATQLSMSYFQSSEIENPNDLYVLQQLHKLYEKEGNKKLTAEFAKRLHNAENGISNTSFYRR